MTNDHMTQISPKTIYHNLRLLEQVNAATSAVYRQLAQEVLADPEVELVWRQAIANRLNHANHLLEMQTANENDSY
jgi:Fe2+ or Zn2+ uptake regulation protein